MTRTTMKSSSRSFKVKDDESYFPFEHSEMPGYDRFFSKDKSEVPANVRYCRKRSLKPKLLLWLEEQSKPFFVPSRGNVNGNVY